MRVSYSSSGLYQSCARKFYHRKIRKTPIDPDCEEDTTALRVGKCFHQVLEDCMHKRELYKVPIIKKAFIDNDITEDTLKGLIMGMVKKYFILHEKQGLETISVEIEIGDETLIGYVDAIMTDDDGGWYIVDLKTAGRLNNSLLSRLSKDPQLNIYSFYAPQIAKMLNLDVDMFRGTRYRVTTKAQIKKNKKESLLEFIKRVFDRVESYDIFIPAESLIPQSTHSHFMRLREKMEELSEVKEELVPQNFGNCEAYFKPCEYWSRCYGKTFTHAAQEHQLYDSVNARKVEIDDLEFL
jgi:hypothetical protein